MLNILNLVPGEKKIAALSSIQIPAEILRLIPEPVARKYNIIPLAIIDDVLQVGMAEVDDVSACQDITAVARMPVEPLLAEADEIRRAIDQSYNNFFEIERQFSRDLTPADSKLKLDMAEISDAPVVRALDLIIAEAVKTHASDIHIEPQAGSLRIRYRIDGLLHDTMTLPLNALNPLLSRVKVMASMNIADHHPQDGQLSIEIHNQEIDIRVATVETVYGEMITLRILDQAFAARKLPELGFVSGSLHSLELMLKSPLGMILVSGPTGSGKTTTLYASINSLDRKSRKVITIEDPPEYRFADIDQIPVNPKAGLTFSTGLRSIMRHDPDVILVGEIRDPDTAEIATQAALTGQLVLSSVHANDTVGALFRLMDLGIGPFLIAATLIGILSQRMTRRVCPYCSRLAEAPAEARMAYAREMGEDRREFFYGQGCNACANTGYLGRVAVLEIMTINQEMRSALISGSSADDLRALARKAGMVSMWRDGMLKAKLGITTPSEVLRNVFNTG